MRLVDAREVAAMLGVTRPFVYEHAAELGAIRLGTGPKARLRFDADEVVTRLSACSARRGSEETETPAPTGRNGRRSRSRSGTDAQLLPIRGHSRHSRGVN